MTPKPKGQNKPTSGMKDWESELASFLNAIPGDIDVPVAYDELKLFIRILLTQSRQEMVEEITRWRDEMCDDGGDWFQKNHWANQLLSYTTKAIYLYVPVTMTPSQVLPREEEKMTNLDTIKAEAVAKLVELMTTSIKENERRDCPYCDFKPQSFRPGKSLVTHIASIHRDKYKTKIEQMGDLLLSEIDRAVGVVIR